MLPINTRLKNWRTDRQKKQTSRDVNRYTDESSSFNEQLLSQLSMTGQVHFKQQLKHLQALMEQAGEDLERHPTLGHLEVFRSLLGQLVAKVVKGGFQVDNVGPGWHPADRHQIVRRIDQEAEALLLLVMDQQKDRVAIARRLVSIKGLVIDLIS